jgi:hypothetical protein
LIYFNRVICQLHPAGVGELDWKVEICRLKSVNTMQNLLTLASLILSCFLLIRILALTDLKDILLTSFCFFVGFVTGGGYILSFLNVLGQLSAWMYFSLITSLALVLIARICKVDLSIYPLIVLLQGAFRKLENNFHEQSLFVKSVIIILAFFLLLTGVLNLLLVIFVPPFSWDGMVFHLPRMAQFIQQNNLNSFYSPNWAQVVHPKISNLLFLFLYLLFGNNENMTQFAQYISYWVFVIAVYGISRRIGADVIQSLFSALIASLLISGVFQSNSNLNDMIMTALFGAATYFLFTFRDSKMYKYLFLAALGIGLVIGVKASALSVIPSIVLIALLTTWVRGNLQNWIKNLFVLLIAILIATFIFAVSSGYVENQQVFGNFMGDNEVRAVHSFMGKTLDTMIRGGIYNLFRYTLNFISLDGLPSIQPVLFVQNALHYIPLKLLSFFNINLEDPIALNYFPYTNNRRPSYTESAYWGVLGFGMVWISVIFHLLKPRKNLDQFILALATIVFLLGVSFSGPYDISRGRYFSIGALFASPLVSTWIYDKRRFTQLYLFLLILLGGISAVSAVALKTAPLFPEQDNLLKMDRLGQLTFFNYRYYRPVVRFEELVPKDAVVAIYFFPNTFEYPLYGRYLTRRILSINSFYAGIQPIPDEAEYLLYANGYPCTFPTDIYLGADWYLRILDEDNRTCEVSSP